VDGSRVSFGELSLARVGGPEAIAGLSGLAVVVLVSECGVLSQDGREALLEPGDAVLLDADRRYELAFEHALVLNLPRHMLPLRPWQLAELTARRICGQSGMGSLLSPFLTLLAARALDGDVSLPAEVRDAVLDLLAATFRTLPVASRTPHQAFLRRVQVHIEQRLGDPALCTASLAAAHHVSPRYLQKLFQEEGSTVTAWIRARRLERCHRDLLDPGLAHVPVAAIGSRWGYPDPANFSRAFRSAYREAPSGLRARLVRRTP
jgi:AraC-like DNA-binding protein